MLNIKQKFYLIAWSQLLAEEAFLYSSLKADSGSKALSIVRRLKRDLKAKKQLISQGNSNPSLLREITDVENEILLAEMPIKRQRIREKKPGPEAPPLRFLELALCGLSWNFGKANTFEIRSFLNMKGKDTFEPKYLNVSMKRLIRDWPSKMREQFPLFKNLDFKNNAAEENGWKSALKKEIFVTVLATLEGYGEYFPKMNLHSEMTTTEKKRAWLNARHKLYKSIIIKRALQLVKIHHGKILVDPASLPSRYLLLNFSLPEKNNILKPGQRKQVKKISTIETRQKG